MCMHISKKCVCGEGSLLSEVCTTGLCRIIDMANELHLIASHLTTLSTNGLLWTLLEPHQYISVGHSDYAEGKDC